MLIHNLRTFSLFQKCKPKTGVKLLSNLTPKYIIYMYFDSEDQDKMLQNVAIHQYLHYLLRYFRDILSLYQTRFHIL